MKIEINAVKDSVCEELYISVMDETSVSSAFDKIHSFSDANHFAEGNTGLHLDSTKLDELNSLDPTSFNSTSDFDIKATILFWEALEIDDGVNTKIQMSDKRIWYDITFNHLREYVEKRWGSSEAFSQRLFMNGSMTSGKLIRQAASRLWWYAFLTFDEASEVDPWHLLKTLCTNTDVQLSLTDRNLAHNEFIIKSTLEYLELETNRFLLKGDNIKKVSKWLLAYSGIMELPMLEPDDFTELMEKIKDRVI